MGAVRAHTDLGVFRRHGRSMTDSCPVSSSSGAVGDGAVIDGMTTGWVDLVRGEAPVWPPSPVQVAPAAVASLVCPRALSAVPNRSGPRGSNDEFHGKSSTLKRLFTKASCAPRRRPAPTWALTFNGEESRIPRASFLLKFRCVGSRGLGLRFSLPALRSCRPPPPGCSPGFHMVPVCEEGAVGFPAVRRVYLPALGEAHVFSLSRKVKLSGFRSLVAWTPLAAQLFPQAAYPPQTALGQPHQALPQGSGSRGTWASPVRSILAGPAFPESPES